MGTYQRVLRKLAHLQVERPYLVLLFILGFTLLVFGGVSQVKTVASLEQMMPPDIEEIKAFNTLRDTRHGKDSIVVVLSVDEDSRLKEGVLSVSDPRVSAYLREVGDALRGETDVVGIDSYAEHIPKEKSFSQVFSETPEVVTPYLSEDRKTTILMINSDVARDDQRMNLLVAKVKGVIDDLGHPPGIEISYTGTPIIQQRLGELVNQDRTNTQWISLLFVFIITGIVFRSVTSAIIPILVVFLSVNWLYGTMGYTGLPISTLAGGVAAMVVGIGIDFSIHLMNKFKYERKQGYKIKEAVELAVVNTGTALTATSFTTIGAFLTFLIGVMPEMGRFGILMAIGIFYALVFSVVGLPALLVLEEKLLYHIKKRSHFGIEGEYHLEGGERV